jgi:thiamine biosynthesis protein ThiI
MKDSNDKKTVIADAKRAVIAGYDPQSPQREILIVRYGEVALKGMNKPYFERILLGRIRNAIKAVPGAGELIIERDDGLIVVSGREAALPADTDVLTKKIAKVFGVATISSAIALSSRNLGDIEAACIHFMQKRINGVTALPVTFKIYGKRSDKTYPITSPDMSAKVGGAILDLLQDRVKVDVHDPDIALFVHLRRKEVFIYDEKISGFGGLPLGTNGRGMILLSGGIDSPVAAFLMAKRGMRIEAVHYHSYPYTSNRAQEKVRELAEILAGYVGSFRMHTINLLPAQEAIARYCKEDLMTILVRRFMMKLAERVALAEDVDMLITGENLGQVASQTAAALCVTDEAVKMPVMRPLIGMDKIDIIEKAQEIGTYEKSIEPYEDCCTVFLPKHPSTRPKPEEIQVAEAAIPNYETLLNELYDSKETTKIQLPT